MIVQLAVLLIVVVLLLREYRRPSYFPPGNQIALHNRLVIISHSFIINQILQGPEDYRLLAISRLWQNSIHTRSKPWQSWAIFTVLSLGFSLVQGSHSSRYAVTKRLKRLCKMTTWMVDRALLPDGREHLERVLVFSIQRFSSAALFLQHFISRFHIV